MLRYQRKVTLTPAEVTPEDADRLREVGISEAAFVDAMYVCFAFNVIDRMADSLEFAIPSDDDFAASARMLVKRGYRL